VRYEDEWRQDYTQLGARSNFFMTFCYTDFVEILSNISDQLSWQYLGN